MALTDRFGRVHRDLRISLIDHCNLCYTYCTPPEGVSWLPRTTLLTPEELMRTVWITAGEGIEEVRLTGGEPLLCLDHVDVMTAIASVESHPEISITTDSIGLARLTEPLERAGLMRVNVSLDTLKPDRLHQPTHHNRLADVLARTTATNTAGLHPVKSNTSQLRGTNGDETPNLLAFVMDHGYELRFIEQMPLGMGYTRRRDSIVTAAETMARLDEHFTLTPLPGRDAAPVECFLVDGGPVIVGIIALATAPSCGACDRLRLIADEQLRNCLFVTEESDLHIPMREGAGDEELAGIFHRCLLCKLPGHGINDPGFLQPQRPMNTIGGQLFTRTCGYHDGV